MGKENKPKSHDFEQGDFAQLPPYAKDLLNSVPNETEAAREAREALEQVNGTKTQNPDTYTGS